MGDVPSGREASSGWPVETKTYFHCTEEKCMIKRRLTIPCTWFAILPVKLATQLEYATKQRV